MLKVLIVEDEELIRKGIALTVDWATLDCVVVGEAANGAEGLEKAEKCDPDLIITDLKCPRWTASKCWNGSDRQEKPLMSSS